MHNNGPYLSQVQEDFMGTMLHGPLDVVSMPVGNFEMSKPQPMQLQ